MPIKEILLLGNQQLWQPSAAIADIHSQATQALVTDLADTLADFRLRNGFGRAIAAPQIGALQKMIFVNLRDGSDPFALINPHIVNASDELFELWDDCFSLPNLMVRVRRHVSIDVRFADQFGKTRELTATDDLSELLQHEIDHLSGILATDRAIDARSLALRSEAMKNQGTTRFRF
ncbi:MAG: peptide deformylase [Acidobacteria bacterium]|nr:peptide deformylase [Acidobacteriota bacterium]